MLLKPMILPFPPIFEIRMRAAAQPEWEEFALAHRAEPPVSIRLNRSKNNSHIEDAVPWTALGKYLNERSVFTLDPTFHAGAYYVQEASSMFLEQAVRQSVDLSQPLRVLDLCAAPGGKSTHLLSMISTDSLLVANEVIRSRATTLSENIQKWGHPNVVVTNNDPEDFQRLTGFFDLIVVDAPCSGEGLFRKDPMAMEEWSPENVALCAQRQRRILSDVWPALKENGVLIYCTCTYNEEENEDNLIWLGQQNNSECVELEIKDAWGVQPAKKGNVTGYRFFPNRLKGEGFFIAALRKTREEVPARTKSKFSFASPPAKTIEQLREWVRDSSRFQFVIQDDLILMIPLANVPDVASLSERLKILTKGTALATLKREKLVPEHAGALSIALKGEFFAQEKVDKEHALAYLRKDNLFLGEGKRGFALAMYEDLPLGWVNLLGNRMNNLYPSSWRIRMSPKTPLK